MLTGVPLATTVTASFTATRVTWSPNGRAAVAAGFPRSRSNNVRPGRGNNQLWWASGGVCSEIRATDVSRLRDAVGTTRHPWDCCSFQEDLRDSAAKNKFPTVATTTAHIIDDAVDRASQTSRSSSNKSERQRVGLGTPVSIPNGTMPVHASVAYEAVAPLPASMSATSRNKVRSFHSKKKPGLYRKDFANYQPTMQDSMHAGSIAVSCSSAWRILHLVPILQLKQPSAQLWTILSVPQARADALHYTSTWHFGSA